ncbi:NAD(P)-binding domain-containing protein [Rhizobium mongolense]|uniref:NAD(P)-binding domain-containing protein n=1 Tax=Rhizobium mongolense TaxID=57676 RepID=UPI0011A50F9E|nr:NAD(P)-binding domain-containing protein [Rhizobium mongolense]
MGEVLDVVVIGAGSTGLGISYFLKREAREHKVLDGGRIGETWRTQRWDSFRLNSPTIRSVLPGDSYRGPDPWGTITHHEFVSYLEDYAERHCLPVCTQTSVKELTRENGLFRLTTAPGVLLARNVVIATGDQNRQVRPPASADLPVELCQVDSSAYRNAAQQARSPQVRTHSFTARPPDLLRRSLPARPGRHRLISGSCPSARSCDPRFLPTVGRPSAVALLFARHDQLTVGLPPTRRRPCWAHNAKRAPSFLGAH